MLGLDATHSSLIPQWEPSLPLDTISSWISLSCAGRTTIIPLGSSVHHGGGRRGEKRGKEEGDEGDEGRGITDLGCILTTVISALSFSPPIILIYLCVGVCILSPLPFLDQ